MTLRPFRFLRKADRRQELDREQWADLDRIVFEQTVIGEGQHLLEEPIYFGRAFDRPPFFTYSAVGNIDSLTTEVKAISHPGIGIEEPDSLNAHGWINDPSFEVQGRYSSYIPRLFEGYTYLYYQQLYYGDRQVILPYHGTKTPEFMNFWIQGEDYIPPALLYGTNILKDSDLLNETGIEANAITAIGANFAPIYGQPDHYKTYDGATQSMSMHYHVYWLAYTNYFDATVDNRSYVSDVNPPGGSTNHIRKP